MLQTFLHCMIIMVIGSAYWTEALAQPSNPMRAPSFVSQSEQKRHERSQASFPAAVFDVYLQFFQRIISPVDGARSNMYPTGSAYARQAFAKHGALLGVVLTTERLMHEGNEARIAPRIRKYGLWRVFDPVEANDWWWQGSAWVYTPHPRLPSR